MVEKEYCFHVEPKEYMIKGENPKPHKCNLKEAISLENKNCVASLYTNDYGFKFMEYRENYAKGCPLFAKNQDEAKRVLELLKGL